MRFSKESPRMLASIVAVLAGCCMIAPRAADADAAPQSVVLEVIVKFSNDSDLGRRIGKLMGEHPMDPGALADLKAPLRASTGLALTPVSVTSGRELLVRIEETPLLERVKQSLESQPEVDSATMVAAQDENPRLPRSMLLVRFPAASDAAALMKTAHGDGGHDAAVQALAAKLCAGSGVPVLGTAQQDARLAVTLDRYRLLGQVTAQFGRLDDVDYAQPNAILQLMK